MNSNQLLDALKAHAGVPSDYALAREVLKIHQGSLKEMRERGLSDERALQIAGMIGLDEAPVLAAIHAERAKDPKVKKAWERIAKSLRAIAASALLLVGFPVGGDWWAMQGSNLRPLPCEYNALIRFLRHVGRISGFVWSFFAGFRSVLKQAIFIAEKQLLTRLSMMTPRTAAFAVVLSLSLSLSAPVNADDRCQFRESCAFDEWHDAWTDADTARQAVYLALQYVDYRQTMVIARNPDRFSEGNRILGEHPSESEVRRYHLAAALLHTGISYVLPADARKWWQYIAIGIEAEAVHHNYSVGIRVNF